jgi:DNA-binding NarL/FixJ family response regulator
LNIVESGEHRLEWSTIRVLVVDDYEPFRRFVCKTLGKRPDTQVIGEASDGLSAIRKAEELKPDLIVLDIGLPTLNGIEVGRRIRKLCPEVKILFLSQETDVEVVHEAFDLGALAYIVKAHAGSELAAAVESVCQGRLFVGEGLLGHNRTDAIDAQDPGDSVQHEVSPLLVPEAMKIIHNHGVHFYSDDAAFLLGLACFVEAALNAGNPVIVVATESHRKGLFQTLLARGMDAAAAMEQGLYIALDVYDVLLKFMVNDLPDSARFLKIFGDLLSSTLKAAKARHPKVAALGELAPTLWAQGDVEAAIQVEHLTDQLAKTHNVDILCGYVLTSSQREHESDIYERICAEHSAVLC